MAKNCNTSPFYLQGQSPTIQNQVAIIERFLKKQLPNYAVITVSLNGVDVPKDEFGNVDLDIETIKGEKGDKGDPGEKGDKGDKGEAGIDGKDGVDGVSPHIDSTSGNWFIGNSDTGVHAQGEDGADGSDGSDGKSAYEIWLEQGHTGTVDDFFDWIRGNKVSKFFNSIEELEVGEIGEYQGKINGTFTRGYFYKRGTGTTEIEVVSEGTVTPTYYVDLENLETGEKVRVVNSIGNVQPVWSGECGFYVKDVATGDEFCIYGIPQNDYYYTEKLYEPISPIFETQWYGMPKAWNRTKKEWVNYTINIWGTGNFDWDVVIENVNQTSVMGWGQTLNIYLNYCNVGNIGYVPCMCIANFDYTILINKPVNLPQLLDENYYVLERYGLGSWVYYNSIDEPFTYYTFRYIESPLIQRIDVQPREDTSHYVTDSEIGWIEH